MPCRIPSHKHEWPRSGILSISKCEFKCAFCWSTKDYKPASALRKHVLTHIKNDEMPLTLNKSIGGRPTLQTTAVDSSSRDQPETHPPSPELALTSRPVLAALDAQGDPIKNIDDVFLSIKNMFPREDDTPTYSSRFSHIPDGFMIVEAAVGLAKTLGPEKTLIRRGLDSVRICMAECRKSYDTSSDSKHHRRPIYLTHIEEYDAFRRALWITARGLRHSHRTTILAMVLETIHAMWILSVIIRFSYAHEDPRIVSLVLELDFKPMLQYFETTDMTLDELSYDVYHPGRPGYLEQRPAYWGQSQVRNTCLALDLYHQSISGPAGIEGSGPTVARIIGLLNEIVNSTWKLRREELMQSLEI